MLGLKKSEPLTFSPINPNRHIRASSNAARSLEMARTYVTQYARNVNYGGFVCVLLRSKKHSFPLTFSQNLSLYRGELRERRETSGFYG